MLLKILLLFALFHHHFDCGECQCFINELFDTIFYRLDTSSQYMDLACDQEIENGLWTVVMSRFDGKVAFHNRTMEEYKHGFGYHRDGEEYFIGLDALSALINDRQMELLFDVTYMNNDTKTFKYSEFRFGYSSSEYRVVSHGSYGGAKQNDGGFGDLAFCKFTSIAKPFVGWRIKETANTCWHSNIFGEYPTSDYFSNNTLCWGAYGNCLQVRKLRMLVRPINPFIKSEVKSY